MGQYDEELLASALASGFNGILEGYKITKARHQAETEMTQNAFAKAGDLHEKSTAEALRQRATTANEGRLTELERHNKAMESAAGGLTAPAGGMDMIEQHAQNVLNGTDSVSRIGSTYNPRTKGPILNAIQSRILSLKPDFDFGASERDYKARMATAGSGFQTREAGVEEIMNPGGLMDRYKQSVKDAGLTSYPAINKLKSAWDYQTGGAKFSAMRNNAMAIAEAAQGMIGAGSDKKLDAFVGMLNDRQNVPSPDQIKSGMDTIESLMSGRKVAFGKSYGRSSQYAQPPQASGLPAAAARVVGPRMQAAPAAMPGPVQAVMPRQAAPQEEDTYGSPVPMTDHPESQGILQSDTDTLRHMADPGGEWVDKTIGGRPVKARRLPSGQWEVQE